MGSEFFIFAVVGFFAQIVDGALGMAYGVVSTTMLLSFGVPPAAASASVHAAEMFTTAASATSHVSHRNVNWRLFWYLAPAGILGGVLGTAALAMSMLLPVGGDPFSTLSIAVWLITIVVLAVAIQLTNKYGAYI